MKKINLSLILILCIGTFGMFAQNATLEDLLERLEITSTRSIQDEFSQQELITLKEHFSNSQVSNSVAGGGVTVFGQNPLTLQEYVDAGLHNEVTSVERPEGFVPSAEAGGGNVITFTDRTDYLVNCSNGDFLTLEDLADGPGGFLACSSSISSVGDVCYPAGEIQEGIEFTTSGADLGNTMVAVVPADGFTVDNAVGSITFLDSTIINFATPEPVTSVGFDVYSLTGGSSVDVRVIGAGGLIDTVTLDVTTTGPVFLGIVAAEPILSIELEDLTGVNVELVAQVLYGSCEPLELNDDPDTAINLNVGVVFADFSRIDDNTDATASEVADPTIPDPTCSSYNGGDLWYTATVPASGRISFETNRTDPEVITDTGMSVYEGTIGALVQVECDDDDSADGFFSLINLDGRTPGEVLFVRVFEFEGNAVGTFQVSAYDIPPPTNDDLDGVIALTVGTVFADFPEVGTNVSATDSEVADPTIPDPTCSSYTGGDIWYSVDVPNTGEVTIETNRVPSSITDTGMSVYEGVIGALVEVECDDDDSADGFFSLISLTGRTPGETLYIRVFEFSNNAFGEFQTAAYSDCPVNGGEIELIGGDTETIVCFDSGTDAVDVTLGGVVVGTNSQWVITDVAGVILELPAPPPFDLTALGVGTILIWHLSFEDVTGATVGESAANLAGCFDLSNSVTVEVVDEGGPCEVCDYTLQMFDTFGDGWNGAIMDVLVDGDVVLDDVSLDDDPMNNGSSGSLIFPIFGGADVTTVFIDGGVFPGEISYNILDPNGVVVGSGNVDTNIESGSITAGCASCIAPSNLAATNAGLTSADISWTASDTAIEYNWEIQNTGVAQGDPSEIASGTTTMTMETAVGVFVGGNEYTLYVQSDCGAGDTSVYVSINFVIPPANNNCEDAVVLECGTTVTGNTSAATDSGLNPSPDVFYTYTGTGASENVTVSLCDGGTDYDSLLRVFDDGCALISEIAVNDDVCGLQSELTFLSDGTTTYTIMVEGFGASSGNYSLALTCEGLVCDPPSNLVADDFMAGSVAVSWTAGTGALSYNWEIQDGGVAQGTAGAIAVGTSTGTMDTAAGTFIDGNTYTLYVQSVCEGDQTSDFISVDFTYQFLGVNSIAFEGFRIFPNPASEFLNIRAKNNIEQVTVYNMLGQKIRTQSFNETAVRLDVATIASGAYFVKVTINGAEAIYKFLKN